MDDITQEQLDEIASSLHVALARAVGVVPERMVLTITGTRERLRFELKIDGEDASPEQEERVIRFFAQFQRDAPV